VRSCRRGARIGYLEITDRLWSKRCVHNPRSIMCIMTSCLLMKTPLAAQHPVGSPARSPYGTISVVPKRSGALISYIPTRDMDV
jgi:hypothetical protein